MRKLHLILLFCFTLLCFSQEVKILDVKGKVLIKKEKDKNWYEAKAGMFLEKNTELKTNKDSLCTLAFDDKAKDVLTIRENSEIKLNQIIPANVGLNKGKVVALIKDIAVISDFKIRTPVAVAGVRGTGESVEHIFSQTTVKCFEGIINVESIVGQGKSEDIEAGFGITVDSDGSLGEEFRLSEEDFKEWQDFVDYVETVTAVNQDIRQQDEEVQQYLSDDEKQNVDSFREESRQDNRESNLEEERQRIEQDRQDQEDAGGKITHPGGY